MTDFSEKRLRRIFNNNSWRQGGRFYGGWWQNVPREYRENIRINDKDVVELDYSGLHVNMLYAMKKLPMPTGDVYELDDYSNNKIFRDFVKVMLQAMVNAGSKEEARRALHKSVHFEKEIKLPPEIESTKGIDIFPIIEAFETKHKHIKTFFCTGKGIDLQHLDSQMAEKVMLHFSNMGYTILPIHDSFIIHHALENEIRKAMEMAFKDIFGVNIKVDLKYNSLTNRLEMTGHNPDYLPEPCETPLTDILKKISPDGPYGTYHALLNEHREYWCKS